MSELERKSFLAKLGHFFTVRPITSGAGYLCHSRRHPIIGKIDTLMQRFLPDG
ncbi:MAG: hypothetical protein MUF06_13830 [Pirellulaceae bacterium]|nr:hypothetical protein [Pirellulaceae bacterium]